MTVKWFLKDTDGGKNGFYQSCSELIKLSAQVKN